MKLDKSEFIPVFPQFSAVRFKEFVTCDLSKKHYFLVTKMSNQFLPVIGMCISKHDFFIISNYFLCCSLI